LQKVAKGLAALNTLPNKLQHVLLTLCCPQAAENFWLIVILCFFFNFPVSNIRVSNRTLFYNVCPEAALTWPSRHSRHRHLCRFYRSLN